MATYPYGLRGAPTVGNGLGGLPRRTEKGWGEVIYTIPGTYVFKVPTEAVHSLCAVGVGGGGASNHNDTGYDIASGAGGALAWVNDVPVTAFSVVTVTVGTGGQIKGSTGTSSKVIVDGVTVFEAGPGQGGVLGSAAIGGAVIKGNGGAGGNGANQSSTSSVSRGGASGGAAGGYSGKGGDGVAGESVTLNGNNGTGGAGASGGVNATGGEVGGAGGVNLFGEGASGTAGSMNSGGTGGSGGQDGASTGIDGEAGPSGLFGAGGGIGKDGVPRSWRVGANGAVRILWGVGRRFPSTNVEQSY